jgi:glycosyltransferase involved in cell wall biosynthesis
LRLLVVIPALNEAPTIASVIGAIPRQIPGVCEIDVVVVDDGSSDATAQEAERAGARVLRHSTPRGVGAAFHTALGHGIEHGADLIASIDADGQFDPADLPALIEPVVSGRADFVTGSRFVDPALVPEMPALKLWGNRVLSRLISRLAGQTLHDVSCGMRCFGRRAALGLHPMGRFTYTQEVLLNLAFQQLRLQEVPIRVRGEREFGESRVASSLWRYALRSSGIILRCYRDYFPMRFFGGLAALLAIPGLGLLGFLGAHYLWTGAFSPYKWTGFAGATLAALSLVLLHMAVIGDMLNRHRRYLEELLYRERERARPPAGRDDARPPAP